MVQPVAVTTTFMPEGYAIREYKRIVQGGSAAATELLCYGTSVVVERLEERVRASEPELRCLRGIGGRLRRN